MEFFFEPNVDSFYDPVDMIGLSVITCIEGDFLAFLDFWGGLPLELSIIVA